MTLQTLIDRQLIQDQTTRYYYNFGKAERQSEENFYAEDGELILGTRHYKGREGIKSAYNRPPAAAKEGAAPAAAAPPRERLAFNVAIGNPLIIVHGTRPLRRSFSPSTGRRRRSDEVHDSGQGVRDVGQGERTVPQHPPDRQRQQSAGRLERIVSLVGRLGSDPSAFDIPAGV